MENPYKPIMSKRTGVGCHYLFQCMKVKSASEVTPLCPTLRNPMDCSFPGSSIHGISQARVLEWGAIAISNINNQERGKKESPKPDWVHWWILLSTVKRTNINPFQILEEAWRRWSTPKLILQGITLNITRQNKTIQEKKTIR